MRFEDLGIMPILKSDEVSVVSAAGPPIRPAERILLYNDTEWEVFVHEWAATLSGTYDSVRRFGGAGDKGVDVAGFVGPAGFEGAWDCFQAKHYDHALTPGDAFPEIAKLLRNVRLDELTKPRRYYFVAPRGCGTSLTRFLRRPDVLKSKFLEWIGARDSDYSDAGEIYASANAMDFSVFADLIPEEMIESHRASPYHLARFGGQLPPRGTIEDPPVELDEKEFRYVEQLVDVYDHEWPRTGITTDTVGNHPKSARQFLRQRLRFYSAESLARYARDEVPGGTFERLQADILSGVIDTAEASHGSPLSRMNAVFEVVSAMQLTAHALIAVTSHDDRRGICHQLANKDELIWKP